MLKHYVKVALRLIKRSFLFSSINMLGFVVGMTAAFLIYLWIVDELTFEDFNKNRNEIYRVIKEDTNAPQPASTVTGLSAFFRESFSKVENATFIKYSGKYGLHFEDKFIDAQYAYIDTTFFDVFNFPVVAGDPNLMKQDPQQIVLSEAIAQKLFGDVSPVGKEVVCTFWNNPRYFKVAAVLKVPRKSHIQFEVLESWHSYIQNDRWWKDIKTWYFSERMHVFIQLKKGATLMEEDRLAFRNSWKEHSDVGKPVTF